jgi:hypothetical protein
MRSIAKRESQASTIIINQLIIYDTIRLAGC